MSELFTTNFEKYNDTSMYDSLNDHHKLELRILLEHLKATDSILELACGTGRLTLPLAEQGYDITGVDLHEGMLKKAQEKASNAGLSIAFFQQDCTQLSLPHQNDFIFMVGNSFQHFLTNQSQDQLFESVFSHLKSGGIFVFDTRNPVLTELAEPDVYDTNFQDYRGYDVKEHHVDTYEPNTQILHCKTERALYKSGQLEREEKDQILLRYTFPLEMKRLLSAHGFLIKESFGNWNGAVISDKAPQLIYVCEKGTEPL